MQPLNHGPLRRQLRAATKGIPTGKHARQAVATAPKRHQPNRWPALVPVCPPRPPVPPGEFLAAWLQRNGGILSSRHGPGLSLDDGLKVREVLDGKPLTEAHAVLLAWGSGIPARFWIEMERAYRAGLTDGSDKEASR